jgi:AmmeMemoRadiSam system protein B
MNQVVGPILIVASSDMNHYELADVSKAKDKLALDRILELDPEGLYEVVRKKDISMCGVLPVTAALFTAKALGAKQAALVRYANSGDVSGDYDAVVGYASLIIN